MARLSGAFGVTRYEQEGSWLDRAPWTPLILCLATVCVTLTYSIDIYLMLADVELKPQVNDRWKDVHGHVNWFFTSAVAMFFAKRATAWKPEPPPVTASEAGKTPISGQPPEPAAGATVRPLMSTADPRHPAEFTDEEIRRMGMNPLPKDIGAPDHPAERYGNESDEP